MENYAAVKKVVLNYFEEMEKASQENAESVLKKYTSNDYLWRGVYPFLEKNGAGNVAKDFWIPLKQSLKHMQRRQDIFIAGTNEISGEEWVMSMGHFMGLFDEDWLGIKSTGKMIHLRYAEFNCVANGKITQTAMFIDIIGLMQQAGINPLPPATGNYFVYPGPRNHDGLLFEDADKEEGNKTLRLVNKMIEDFNEVLDSTEPHPDVLERTWSYEMLWYGPAGIGATYTIPRYQEQHELPFREHLKDIYFKGHVCRFAEGNFACWFGWPNMYNTPTGGFLGLPGNEISAEMRVVDIYYREGDKLMENWVFIDIPYWLKQQGLDILERTRNIVNPQSE